MGNTDIHDYPIKILDMITKEDIMEYLDYMSLYEKEGKTIVNKEKGKARKIAAKINRISRPTKARRPQPMM